MSLVQPLLALALRVGANQVSSYCFFSSFSRGDLRLCLIDTGKRFGYTRVLQLALAKVVFDGGHLRAQRCKVAADVSIISYLFDLAALPRIPVASDSDQNR